VQKRLLNIFVCKSDENEVCLANVIPELNIFVFVMSCWTKHVMQVNCYRYRKPERL